MQEEGRRGPGGSGSLKGSCLWGCRHYNGSSHILWNSVCHSFHLSNGSNVLKQVLWFYCLLGLLTLFSLLYSACCGPVTWYWAHPLECVHLICFLSGLRRLGGWWWLWDTICRGLLERERHGWRKRQIERVTQRVRVFFNTFIYLFRQGITLQLHNTYPSSWPTERQTIPHKDFIEVYWEPIHPRSPAILHDPESLLTVPAQTDSKHASCSLAPTDI